MKNLFLACFALFAFTVLSSCGTADGETAGVGTTKASTDNAKEELISADVVNNPNSAGDEPSRGNLPVMTFEKDMHDFGDVIEGEKVEYNFKFTNTGSSPLVISSAKGSCGCTVPSYPEAPVQPGESDYMTVTFDSKGRKNKFTKEVSITANTEPNVNRLVITGQVITTEQ